MVILISMELPQQITSSIDNLYRVFDRYQPKNFGDPRGNFEDVDRELPEAWLTTPTRELDSETLNAFFRRAMTTFGNTDFFRWILPRVFELMVNEDDGDFLPPLFGSKLDYAEWSTWPKSEQAAIKDSISAVWANFIRGAYRNREVDDWLSFVETAGLPLEPFLSIWDSHFIQSDAAKRHFLDLLESVLPSLPRGKLECFWGDLKYQFEDLKGWILDTRKLDILEAGDYPGSEIHLQVLRNMIHSRDRS